MQVPSLRNLCLVEIKVNHWITKQLLNRRELVEVWIPFRRIIHAAVPFILADNVDFIKGVSRPTRYLAALRLIPTCDIDTLPAIASTDSITDVILSSSTTSAAYPWTSS